ncbi:hypothetical protein [Escherichia coli]|uniref:hypothetical protein n=1 Tax=Escherichia coli TaxID=562 RepID=UPI0037DC53FF
MKHIQIRNSDMAWHIAANIFLFKFSVSFWGGFFFFWGGGGGGSGKEKKNGYFLFGFLKKGGERIESF